MESIGEPAFIEMDKTTHIGIRIECLYHGVCGVAKD
jgi:hypothetical protein